MRRNSIFIEQFTPKIWDENKKSVFFGVIENLRNNSENPLVFTIILTYKLRLKSDIWHLNCHPSSPISYSLLYLQMIYIPCLCKPSSFYKTSSASIYLTSTLYHVAIKFSATTNIAWACSSPIPSGKQLHPNGNLQVIYLD